MKEWIGKATMVAVACVVFAGCATTYQAVNEGAPVHTGQSTKAPEAIAQCVLPKWLGVNAAAHVISEGTTRTVVVPEGSPDVRSVLMTLVITPTQTGSKVEMHKQSMSSFEQQWAQAQECM